MKLSSSVSAMAAATALLSLSAEVSAEEGTCTHGMLVLADVDSTTVRAMDLDGNLADIAVTASIDVPLDVPPEFNLQVSSTTKEVAIIYRGQEDQQYLDGAVRWLDTTDGQLAMIDNAAFDCARAIHYVPHDDKIAIFCDGMVNNVTQVNTTIWVVDETLFRSPDQSAVVFTTTIEGSHHGVAIPVDDNHLLYSVAMPERIEGNYTRPYALPETFRVIDYEGTELHALDDTTNPDTSCAGFHGSWARDNTFALACNDVHGGIVVVDYDAAASAYSSRALLYPEDYFAHRTGSFAEHHDAPAAVGNFANSSHYHLMQFDPLVDQEISADTVLELPARQCSYKFELGEGQLLLVLLPNGMVHVYQVDPDWSLVANVTVVEGMQACTEAKFAAGVGQAFVVHGETLYSLDLDHVMEGEVEISTTQLGFTPFSAIVAGVPPGTACKLSEADHDHHDHAEGEAEDAHTNEEEEGHMEEGEGHEEGDHDHEHEEEEEDHAHDEDGDEHDHDHEHDHDEEEHVEDLEADEASVSGSSLVSFTASMIVMALVAWITL